MSILWQREKKNKTERTHCHEKRCSKPSPVEDVALHGQGLAAGTRALGRAQGRWQALCCDRVVEEAGGRELEARVTVISALLSSYP